MSRVGRMPITIPDKVKIDFKTGLVDVTGPLGHVVQAIPRGITLKIDKAQAIVETTAEAGEKASSLHGLSRSLVNNAVTGVTQGFKKDLEIIGLGYRAAVAGEKLTLTLGFAHPIIFKLPVGIKATIDAKMTQLSISGTDAYVVGEIAARIRRLRKPEPYK